MIGCENTSVMKGKAHECALQAVSQSFHTHVTDFCKLCYGVAKQLIAVCTKLFADH